MVEASRPFHEGYRFLATRYIEFTALFSPLPWYDGMVLDIRKSCIDFSMVSMSGNASTHAYSSVEHLVRDQQVMDGTAG